MIDRGLDDNCGLILAFSIGPKIAPDNRPRITARVKPMTFQISISISIFIFIFDFLIPPNTTKRNNL